MAAFILDASVALAWILPDEADAARASQHMDRVIRDGAAVPAIWALEMANVLLVAERTGRIDSVEMDAALAGLAALPIDRDVQRDTVVWGAALPLARRHRLSVYDATYLELAHRRALPLASFDSARRRAALAEQVPLAD